MNAVEKALAGTKAFRTLSLESPSDQGELAAQVQAIQAMKAYADSWKALLP